MPQDRTPAERIPQHAVLASLRHEPPFPANCGRLATPANNLNYETFCRSTLIKIDGAPVFLCGFDSYQFERCYFPVMCGYSDTSSTREGKDNALARTGYAYRRYIYGDYDDSIYRRECRCMRARRLSNWLRDRGRWRGRYSPGCRVPLRRRERRTGASLRIGGGPIFVSSVRRRYRSVTGAEMRMVLVPK